MNIVENISSFLRVNGLNWTGKLMTGKDEDFRPATAEDFEELNNVDLLISFGKDGEMALSAEIDIINFKILGESFDVACFCYAGDKEENKKLCEGRDLSKDWVKFQLKSSGLIYAVALKTKCDKEREKVEQKSEQRVKQLSRKIAYLQRSIEKVTEDKKQHLNEIKSLEDLADEVK